MRPPVGTAARSALTGPAALTSAAAGQYCASRRRNTRDVTAVRRKPEGRGRRALWENVSGRGREWAGGSDPWRRGGASALLRPTDTDTDTDTGQGDDRGRTRNRACLPAVKRKPLRNTRVGVCYWLGDLHFNIHGMQIEKLIRRIHKHYTYDLINMQVFNVHT